MADYQINNTIFRVVHGDITKISADALVSSDDNYLTMGGGVSEALSRAAGEGIRKEAKKHTPLKLGDVAVTSAGRLSAKYIFHAVTIDLDNLEGPSEEYIYRATSKCMQLADALGVRVIAFPALGTGTGLFPAKMAADVMTRAIAGYLAGETQIELVIVTLFTSKGDSDRELNSFYEHAVALASISTQSKRLGTLLTGLENIVGQKKLPETSKNLVKMKHDLIQAQKILEKRPKNLEDFDKQINRSGISEISRKIVTASSEAESTLFLKEKRIQKGILENRLNTLIEVRRLGFSSLNHWEIERAKYGGIGVPPLVENAIKEVGQDIEKVERQIREVKERFAMLN
ncbi:MAG: macro domain-containing protein [Candidatus Hodarchaeota archaeon]